jgi:NAD(P)H-hydrate epimerase
MKVLTAEQMAYVDHATIERGTPGIELMRNAGREVFTFIQWQLRVRSGIVIVAGKGNNGGDGFRVAELCAVNGYGVTVYLVGDKADMHGDAAVCLHAFEMTNHSLVEIKTFDDIQKLSTVLQSAELIVDSLFGTGLKGQITGLAAAVLDEVNKSEAPVVAVDIPSGVDATTGEVSQSAVQAEYTVTFGCFKVGHVVMPGRGKCGEVHVAEIGLNGEIMDSVEQYACSLSRAEAFSLLPKRPYTIHKGAAGRVFVLAGSVGMTGAATLSSLAAMRAGAGVVTLGCPQSLNDILEVKVTEVMTLPLPEVRKKRCLALRALGQIRKAVRSTDVVAVGPGLGRYRETVELVKRFLAGYQGRVVLDADGINAFQGDFVSLAGTPCEIVITPHYGELSRLIGVPIEQISHDPLRSVKEAAHITGKIVLLKGAPTVIAGPKREVWVNATGNPGMATAGMGDVLTGVISGLAAQGLSLFDAAVLGAYVHGLAGDWAMREKGMLGMMSGDVLELVPRALIDISGFSG